MSLLALLAATGDPVVVDPDPDPTASVHGAAVEAFVLDHNNYAIVEEITDPTTPIRTVAAAVRAALPDEHLTTRGLIILHPGIYTEAELSTGESGGRVDFVSSTLGTPGFSPRDVELRSSTGLPDSLLYGTGVQRGLAIIAGIYVPGSPAGDPHHDGGSGPQCTMVYYRCELGTEGAPEYPAQSLNNHPNMQLHYLDCTMWNTYIHNSSQYTGDGGPCLFVFDNVTGDNHGLHDGAPENWGDLVLIRGGNMTGPPLELPGPSMAGIIDPATFGETDYTGNAYTDTRRPLNTEIPNPLDNTWYDTYWGDDLLGVAHSIRVGTNTTTMTLTPNRWYFLQMTLDNYRHATSITVNLGNPNGTMRAFITPNARTGATMADPERPAAGRVQTVETATSTVTLAADEYIAPGQRAWVGICTTGTGVTIEAGTQTGVWYADSTNGADLPGYPNGGEFTPLPYAPTTAPSVIVNYT